MSIKRNFLGLIFLLISLQTIAQDAQEIAKKILKSTVSITMFNYAYSDKIMGSAFVVEKNVIATNYHVISLGNEGFIQKSQTDSAKIPIKRIIAVDVENDLALLEVEDLGLPPIEITTAPLNIGEKIYVAGNPMGLSGTFSDGIVSANRRLSDIQTIQITAPVSSGSSGGPVMNSSGKVVGVVFSSMKAGQNLNFVVPAEKLVSLLERKTGAIQLNQPFQPSSSEEDMKSILHDQLTSEQWSKIKTLKIKKDQQTVLETNKEINFVYNSAPFLFYKPDFKIQARIKTAPDKSSCLYWGALSGTQFDYSNGSSYGKNRFTYVFCQKAGQASLNAYVGNDTKKLYDDKSITKANSGDFNIFKIHKKSDSLFFSINDEIVFKRKYDKYLDGEIGIGSEELGTKIIIDYMEIKQADRTPNVHPKVDTTIKATILPSYINSKYNDLFPIVSLDGEKIYLTRYKSPKNQGKNMAADIYEGPLNGKEGDLCLNTSKYNDEYDNYCFGLTNGGSGLYIEKIVYKYERFRKDANLTIFNLDKNESKEVPNFKSFYCYDDYSVYTISSDEKTIIVSLKRADTFGSSDLYVSHKDKDKNWTQLVNLGPVINSLQEEGAAFITADNKFLIFSSGGHAGYGQMDLFISERLDSTWLNWSKPVNLGSGINSAGDENYPYLCLKKNELYFSQYPLKSNQADIFKVKLNDAFFADVTLGKISFEDNDIDVEITSLSDLNSQKFNLGKRNNIHFVFQNHVKYSIKCFKGDKLIAEKEVDFTMKKGYSEEDIIVKK